jgi:hypothetical protein
MLVHSWQYIATAVVTATISCESTFVHCNDDDGTCLDTPNNKLLAMLLGSCGLGCGQKDGVPEKTTKWEPLGDLNHELSSLIQLM